MRLAVFLNLRFYEHNAKLWADEPYFRFWIKLAENYEHLTLCVPTAKNTGGGIHPVEFDPAKLSVCQLPMYGSSLDLYAKFPLYAWKAAKLCTPLFQNCDVFVSCIPNLLGMWLNGLASRHGVKCVNYLRGNIVKIVEREYHASAAKVIPVMLSHVLEMAARRQMRKHLSFVVGHEMHKLYSSLGIDTVLIFTSLISRSQIRQYTPRISSISEVRLLTVGRLSAERGVETLLEAISILNRDLQSKLVCRIVGDGPERGRLESRAKDLRLDNVTFVGSVPHGDELISHYRWANIFVLPSHTDAFPKVLQEAMANAVPVVSTAVGGIPDVLTNRHDCILVPPGRAKDMSEGISELSTNIDLLNRIGANAFHTVQKLTYEEQSAVFVNTLQKHMDTRVDAGDHQL